VNCLGSKLICVILAFYSAADQAAANNSNSKTTNKYANCDMWDGTKWVTLTHKEKDCFVSGYLLCTKFSNISKIMDNTNVIIDEVDNFASGMCQR